MIADTSVGAEVDGGRLTFAVAHGPRIGAVDQITARSPGAAITELLHRIRPGGAITVAWAARTTVVRQLPVPIVPTDRRRAVLDAVAARASITGVVCARLGGPVPDANEVIAVVGGASASEVQDVFRDAHDPPVHLVLAPMVLSTDGIWLAVRLTGVELTVVEDGLPRLSRTLSCGGLDRVAARLGAYGGDGSRRVDDVLDGSGRAEPDTLRMLDDYVADLSIQVRDSLAYWRRSERIGTPALHVIGAGATLPTLEARLAAVQISAFGPPDIEGRERVSPAACTAIEAALVNRDAVIGFPDELGATRRAASQRAATSSRRVVTTAVLGGAATLALALPIAQGRLEKHQASAALKSATGAIRRLRADEATYTYVSAAVRAWATTAGVEPDWAVAISSVVASSPPTTRIVSLAFDTTTRPDAVAITLQAETSDPTLRDLQQWTAALQANPLVSSVFSTSAASRTDQTRGSTFELQFTVAGNGWRTPRPFTGVST